MLSNVLIVAAVLVAAGGVIAYIGDMIGKRLGKRRASIFGLRPKFTAILVSTTTGVVIALLSLAVMLALFGRVRDALLHYDELKGDIVRAEEELNQAREEEEKSRRAVEEAQAEHDKAEQARQEAEQLATEADADRVEAETRRTEAEAELGSTLVDLKSTEADLTSAEASLEDRESDLEKVEEQFGTISAGFVADALRARPTSFLEGNELARVILTSDMDRYQIRQALVDLKDTADKVAEREGAAPIRDLDEEARFTVFVSEEDANSEAGKLPLTPNREVREAMYDQATDQILKYLKDYDRVIAQIVAVFDSVEGRPVLVKLSGGPIRRVLSAGDELARLDIDASLPYDGVVSRLQELADKVGWAALERGMIPPPQGTFGSLRPSEINDLVSRIQRRGGMVPVAVRAAADMDNIDELVVRFRVVE